MSNNKKTEEKSEKVMTKYDRKMEKRRIEEEKELKSLKRFKIGSIIIIAAIAAAVVISIGTVSYTHLDVYKRQDDDIRKASKITCKMAGEYLGISSMAVSIGMRNNLIPIGFAIHNEERD